VHNQAPLVFSAQPVCPKPKPQPWVTPELKKLLQARRNLNRRTQKHPADETLRQRYRSVRREGKLLNKRLKTNYFIQEFSNLKRNPRGQWALLNSMSGRGTLRTTPRADMTDLTDTFARIVHDPSRQPMQIDDMFPQPEPAVCESPELLAFKPVTADDVRKLMKNLNTAKSPGPDGVISN